MDCSHKTLCRGTEGCSYTGLGGPIHGLDTSFYSHAFMT